MFLKPWNRQQARHYVVRMHIAYGVFCAAVQAYAVLLLVYRLLHVRLECSEIKVRGIPRQYVWIDASAETFLYSFIAINSLSKIILNPHFTFIKLTLLN